MEKTCRRLMILIYITYKNAELKRKEKKVKKLHRKLGLKKLELLSLQKTISDYFDRYESLNTW